MYEYNLYNLLRIKIDKKLPFFAIRNAKKYSGLLNKLGATTSFKETLIIEPLTSKLETSLSDNTLEIDASQYIDTNRFLEKCQYKFSKWKYLLYYNQKTKEWHFAIKGDFSSNFVWPGRTLSNIIKLLLGMHGCFSIHAASFFYQGNAILILAPSGTGKTLTTLHWLCEGNQIYSDDTSIYYDGKILPDAHSISFWEYRYKKNKNVLPSNMPSFSFRDKITSYLFRFLKLISRGYIGFGMAIDLKKCFVNPIANPASPSMILSLKKGDKIELVQEVDRDVIINRLIGDFIFQSLPIIRWMDVMMLTGSNLLPCKKIVENYNIFIRNLINNRVIYSLTVPSNYSIDVYKKIKSIIRNEETNI